MTIKKSKKQHEQAMGNLGKTLKNLNAKAADLMKLTKEQEDFGKRKQACFLEMLELIEYLSKSKEIGSQDIEGFADDATELLKKYKDDLGKEQRSKETSHV